MYQIVHGVEVSGPRRVAKTRMRRRDDLGARSKQIEERPFRVHRVQAMQQQDRRTRALAQDLEVDATYRKPLDPHRNPYMRSLIRIAAWQPALITVESSR